MKINLYYYNAYITFNGQKTNLPFSRILDDVMVLDDRQKFSATKHGEYSLLRMRHPSQNTDINDRSVCFADYRVRKPKIGERGGDRFEDIDEDVFESTNCFYQHTNNLFIIEYNHYGAKAKQIESYLSSFLPNNEALRWGIELMELDPDVSLGDVLDSDDIRFLDIKLDVTTHKKNQINQPQEPNYLRENIINPVVAAQEELGGNVAQIYFGNGRKKDNLLDVDAVKNLINALDLDSDLYISIKVKYYSSILERLTEIDLKNASVLKNEIAVDGDSWETIADSIEETFYSYGRLGEGKHNRFNDEITVVSDFPKIIVPVLLESN